MKKTTITLYTRQAARLVLRPLLVRLGGSDSLRLVQRRQGRARARGCVQASMTDTAENVTWWAEEAQAATANRNDWIRKMRDEGETLRAIADAAGLSHTAIARIVAG